MKRANEQGFTLIEVVMFIVIMGILGVGILLGLNVALEKSPSIEKTMQATAIAEQRMEYILGLYKVRGFYPLGTTDPCSVGSPPAICTVPIGYTVTTTITTPWSSYAYLKEVKVTVSGDGDATLTALEGSYR